MSTRQTYRVFLSSPGDVAEERRVAHRVVQSINADYGYTVLELIRWEEDFYRATSTFQDQIAPTTECDMVICIFWKNLGSELPEHYRRSDGVLPTGSEYEFETAIEHSIASPNGVPDVLVYRKTASKMYEEENVRLQEMQRARLNSFWTRWFENERGHFVAAFHAFETDQDFARDLDHHLRRWLAQRRGDVVWEDGSPFRGLRPFELADEPIFLGRDREIGRTRARFLANATAGQRFLMVTGPSGSGKSSLLRAGVLPRLLRTQAAPGLPAFARYAILRPATMAADAGGWPSALAQNLFAAEALGNELATGDYDTPEALAALLAGPSEGALPPLRKALARAASSPSYSVALILLLDQFEELFAWPCDDQNRFLALIDAMIAELDVFVISGMRSDYLHRIGETPVLARLCQLDEMTGRTSPVLTLTPPSPADMRDLITGPAHLAGLQFEPAQDGEMALEDRIEQDADPEMLPALQLLLAELYESRDGTVLTHAGYDALGGVTGVMAAQGDAALAALPPKVADSFPGLARRLVSSTALDGTTVARSAALADLTEAEQGLTAALIERGLLIADGPRVSLAHEALIQGWDRLADVILEDQALLQARHRLSLQAARFETDGTHTRDGLLQGHSLAEGRQLAKLWSEGQIGAENPALPAFIAQSDRADRVRKLRRGLGIAAAVLLVTGGLFQGTRMRADLQRAELSAELASSTAKAARASLGSEDWGLAVQESLRARELSADADTLSLALSVVLAADGGHLLAREAGPFADVSYGPDGALVRLDREGQLHIGAEWRQLPQAPQGYRKARVFTNGQIAAVTATGVVHVLPRTGPPRTLPQPVGPVLPEQIALSETQGGFAVALVQSVGPTPETPPVLVHDCQWTETGVSCTAQRFGPPGARVAAVTLSPDGRRLALAAVPPGHTLSSISQADLATGTETTLGPAPGARQIRFIGDQLVVGEGYGQGATPFWLSLLPRVAVPQTAGDLTPHPGHLRFGTDADRRRIAYACGARVLCIAQQADDGFTLLARIHGLPGPLSSIAFSPDGQRVATLLASGELREWVLRPEAGPVAILPGLGAPVLSVEGARNGTLTGVDQEGRVLRWTGAGAAELIARVPTSAAFRPHLAALRDGRLAVADGSPMLHLIDPTSGAVRAEQQNWPIVRVAPVETGGIAAAALQELRVGVTALPYTAFGDGSARLGGIATGPDALYLSATDGGLYRVAQGSVTRAVPQALSADGLAALSLDLTRSGRFLVATRSDERVHIHDLETQTIATTLTLPTRDSKTVAFSPGDRWLAVLTSAGGLGVWHFEPESGQAQPHFFVDPVPAALIGVETQTGLRAAQWLSWINEDTLAIASASGDVITLDVSAALINARLAELREIYAGPED